MPLFKRSEHKSSVVVSSSVYSCASCGHTEIVKATGNGPKSCPKCNGTMNFISAQCGQEESTTGNSILNS